MFELVVFFIQATGFFAMFFCNLLPENSKQFH